ncbi:flagellar biosynthetic protein FliO [Plesiomonas sp.]|uniref:flagellar biosynthetic protein FliO n=1 Tax=Plesiomonas sp. TaxID=2486279 RepID=UPI003F3DF5A1
MLTLFCVLLFTVILIPPLFAVPATAVNTTTFTAAGQSSVSIGMVLLSLLLVLGLIIGLGWLAKRLRLPFHSKGSIQIEQQQALGQRERLLIINVEGQRLLIGVTPQNISLLSILDSMQERGAETNSVTPKNGTSVESTKTVTTTNASLNAFAQQLRAAMQSRSGDTAQSTGDTLASDSAAPLSSQKSSK